MQKKNKKSTRLVGPMAVPGFVVTTESNSKTLPNFNPPKQKLYRQVNEKKKKTLAWSALWLCLLARSAAWVPLLAWATASTVVV